ncbi:MAG: NAD(P)H-dependent oxidoreductase subunit E [SAR324 cluster bacterium]|nr:NAD(P)H-dependent oxidoreductase subunit E [SAR324 cluster bacterium]
MEIELSAFVQNVCKKYGNDKSRLIDILWEFQDRFGCINGEMMDLIAKEISSYRIDVEGVVSFYSFFSKEQKGKIIIRLCNDIVDEHAGMKKIAETFSKELGIGIGKTSADGKFSLEYTSCIGMSDQAPAALVNDVVVTNLTAEKVREIVSSLKENMDPSKLVQQTGDGNNFHQLIHAMVNNNIRKRGEVLLAENITPNAGLTKALEKTPAEVLQEITDSKLRGCGGAGFSTGMKWKMASGFEAERRYVICNADEGEPGTFKDRVLLTERANLVIEGMTIAGYAIQSQFGILYLRAEYRYLRPYLEDVLETRRKAGLLGKNINGKTGFDFDIRIQLGAGAYICGEESALISSCEGLRGEPKNRPPFPVEKGYLNFPTVVNNVETFAHAARILDRGAIWFAGFGTEKSAGTKLISVSGDCERPGIYEVPFGIEVAELLKLAGADRPAIIQVSGPSGKMIGRTQLNRKICFEDLPCGGSFMTFSTDRNVLRIVENFLEFFIEESCGYCTPCRVGNTFLKQQIEKVMKGFASKDDLQYLKDLGQTMKMTSRCGLGTTSPNPVLSSLEHFPIVYSTLVKQENDGLEAGFNIQVALEESRRIAKRSSMIYDPVYAHNENE